MKFSRKLRMGSGIGVVAIGAILIGSGGPPAPAGAVRLASWHHPLRVHLQHEDGNYESYNWAGYAVTGAKGSVTDVKASWQIPTAQCSATYPNGYSAFWVGIDGWNSNTVEQIGTDSDCVGLNGKTDTPTYYAWFEFYPQPGYMIEFPKPLLPGHIISAEVTAVAATATTPAPTVGRPGLGAPPPSAGGSSTKFTATLTDATTGETFTTSFTVAGAQQSSAEWVVEAPCCSNRGQALPLAPFGAADFGSHYTAVANTSYATLNGKPGALGSFGTSIQQSTMVGETNATTIKAQPSAISSDGTSFSVTWLNPGP